MQLPLSLWNFASTIGVLKYFYFDHKCWKLTAYPVIELLSWYLWLFKMVRECLEVFKKDNLVKLSLVLLFQSPEIRGELDYIYNISTC